MCFIFRIYLGDFAFAIFENNLCKQVTRVFVIHNAKIRHHNSPPSCGRILMNLTIGGVGNMNDADDGGGFVVYMGGTTHGDCVRELAEHYSPPLGVNRNPQASS